MSSLWKTVSENWERIVFSVVGLALVGYALRLIYADQIANASIVFGLGFLSFIYANVARFKRFKGLGFEAELWEDKQKEAADLIERLREVVSIYSREIILGKVNAGRFATAPDWSGHWKLYDDLVAQHHALGQKIDFADLKKVMDDFFLFDLCMPQINKIREAAIKGQGAAMNKITQEFGSPIRDNEGYNKRLVQYRAIRLEIDSPFDISTNGNLAEHALSLWKDTQERLKRDFGVDVNVDAKVVERLTKISDLYKTRPVKVTDEIVAWGNRKD